MSAPTDDVDAEQQRAGGAREGQLADAVHCERQVAHHDEDADQPADDAEHRARDQRVVHQRQQVAVVVEVEDLLPEARLARRDSERLS